MGGRCQVPDPCRQHEQQEEADRRVDRELDQWPADGVAVLRHQPRPRMWLTRAPTVRSRAGSGAPIWPATWLMRSPAAAVAPDAGARAADGEAAHPIPADASALKTGWNCEGAPPPDAGSISPQIRFTTSLNSTKFLK